MSHKEYKSPINGTRIIVSTNSPSRIRISEKWTIKTPSWTPVLYWIMFTALLFAFLYLFYGEV